jgi:glycosyltransferase involved in cell wall biosynthesis
VPYSTVGENKAKSLNPNIKSKIIYQGVSDSFFAVKRKSPKYILFLGRFDNHQKGIDLLLNAYNIVKKQIKFPLVIAGHGPDGNKINEQIKNLNLERQVSVYGPAYGKEKDKLAAGALFTAFPSRHDEMSIWSLESLAYGLPLVCFDLPEAKWVPSSVSLKAKPFDVTNYAKLLLQACDKTKIARLQKNARAFAKNFKWEYVARDFLLFFNEILVMEKRPIT